MIDPKFSIFINRKFSFYLQVSKTTVDHFGEEQSIPDLTKFFRKFNLTLRTMHYLTATETQKRNAMTLNALRELLRSIILQEQFLVVQKDNHFQG